MSWDALQREMLAALGHTLYVVSDAPVTRDKLDVGETMPQRRMVNRPAVDRDAMPPNALLHALLRAANLGEDHVPSLQSQLPPLHALVGNATAKRALWPVLRAMRMAQDAK